MRIIISHRTETQLWFNTFINPSCSCTDACRSLWCQAASAVSLLINTWALWFISPPSSQVDSVHARSILTSFRRRHRRADRRTGDKSATLEGTAGPFLVALYGANQRVVKGFPFPRRPFDLLQRIIRQPTRRRRVTRDARARALSRAPHERRFLYVRRRVGRFTVSPVRTDVSENTKERTWSVRMKESDEKWVNLTLSRGEIKNDPSLTLSLPLN